MPADIWNSGHLSPTISFRGPVAEAEKMPGAATRPALVLRVLCFLFALDLKSEVKKI
jgi:hypothetical protein